MFKVIQHKNAHSLLLLNIEDLSDTNLTTKSLLADKIFSLGFLGCFEGTLRGFWVYFRGFMAFLSLF